MIHLQTIRMDPLDPEQEQRYPFRVPAIRALPATPLEFSAEATFFIGENGSGKSTLLEAIACAARAITVGSEESDRDRTLATIRELAAQLKLSWRRRSHRGFFMRSEDFFGYAKRIQALREEAEAELRRIQSDTERSAYARGLASMPHARTISEIEQRYGPGLDNYSHGESYFKLFTSRFVPNGLYLLDEPEAPLSPMRQLGLLALIKMMIEEQQAQFIIATHSPILMAFPGAQIYSFDAGHIQPIAYDQVEHVSLTRDFLNNPQRFLRHL